MGKFEDVYKEFSGWKRVGRDQGYYVDPYFNVLSYEKNGLYVFMGGNSPAKRNYYGVVITIEGIVAKLETIKLAGNEMCNVILSPYS